MITLVLDLEHLKKLSCIRVCESFTAPLKNVEVTVFLKTIL